VETTAIIVQRGLAQLANDETEFIDVARTDQDDIPESLDDIQLRRCLYLPLVGGGLSIEGKGL